MTPPRILILMVQHGASHRRAAAALRKGLLEAEPGLTVEILDGLARCARWFRAYYNSYLLPLKYWPSLWGWIEGLQHASSATGSSWLYRRGGKPLFRDLETFAPDIVVATEVGMCELAAQFKRQSRARFCLVGSPTGVDVDRAWAQPEVDLFIAAPREAAEQLAAAGVPAAKVVACGPPVDPAFHCCPDRDAVRARLNLRRDAPLVLLLFGGSGFGEVRRILPQLKKLPQPFEAACIAGNNPGLERELRRQLNGHPQFHVFGWVDNLHEWMAAADLLVSKPGASTFIEAINSGLPLLAFDPLPGNERRACDLIERWQIGRWAKSPQELGAALEHWLAHPEELCRLRENAIALARPSAAHDAAVAILERWASGI